MANETPVERVQIQAIGTAITPVMSMAAGNREQHRYVVVEQQQGAGVCAEAIGCGVTERFELREADHQVEAHGKEAEDQRFGHDVDHVDGQHMRRERACYGHAGQERRSRADIIPPCRAGRRAGRSEQTA